MPYRKLLLVFGVIALCVGIPTAILHLIASPDDAVITPVQRVAAALANFGGPWAAALVRLVDFPNAGMRSFNIVAAFALTVVGALLIGGALSVQSRPFRIVVGVLWAAFVVVWFGVGFGQIADGLL